MKNRISSRGWRRRSSPAHRLMRCRLTATWSSRATSSSRDGRCRGIRRCRSAPSGGPASRACMATVDQRGRRVRRQSTCQRTCTTLVNPHESHLTFRVLTPCRGGGGEALDMSRAPWATSFATRRPTNPNPASHLRPAQSRKTAATAAPTSPATHTQPGTSSSQLETFSSRSRDRQLGQKRESRSASSSGNDSDAPLPLQGFWLGALLAGAGAAAWPLGTPETGDSFEIAPRGGSMRWAAGSPHDGQAAARSEVRFPHSGQVRSGMTSVPTPAQRGQQPREPVARLARTGAAC